MLSTVTAISKAQRHHHHEREGSLGWVLSCAISGTNIVESRPDKHTEKGPCVGHIFLVEPKGKVRQGHKELWSWQWQLDQQGVGPRDKPERLRQAQGRISCRQAEGLGGGATTHHLGRCVGPKGKRWQRRAGPREQAFGSLKLITEASIHARTSGFRGRAAAPGNPEGGAGRPLGWGEVGVTRGGRKERIRALAFKEPRRPGGRNYSQSPKEPPVVTCY